MSKPYTAWDRFYHKLNMIFNGIVASSLIPFALVFLQNQKEPQAPIVDGQLFDITKMGLIALCGGILFISNWLRPKLFEIVRAETSIENKLSLYLTQKVKQFVVIEAAAFFALLGFYLLQEQIFSFIYVGVLIVFSLHRPSFARVSREINVSEDDLTDWSLNQESDN